MKHETYDDVWVAYRRAIVLNRDAGRREYVVTGNSQGQWVVRQERTPDPGFQKWRRGFNRWVYGS